MAHDCAYLWHHDIASSPRTQTLPVQSEQTASEEAESAEIPDNQVENERTAGDNEGEQSQKSLKAIRKAINTLRSVEDLAAEDLNMSDDDSECCDSYS